MRYKNLFPILLLKICFTLSLQAQQYPGARLITIPAKTMTLQSFFSIVWDQAQVQAFYNEELLDKRKKVEIEFAKEPLDKVLRDLFDKTDVSWCYKDETLILMHKGEGTTHTIEKTKDEEVNIAGVVTDMDGKPLNSVTVRIGSLAKGVYTNENGLFKLYSVNKRAKLTVSRIGYATKEVVIQDSTVLQIQLPESVSRLDESVVIAYGTSTRRNLTGSVGRITADDIAKQPIANPLLAMQGRITGLNITQLSGLAGGEIKVELRGRNSIAAGNIPLFVVDGMPFPGTALTMNNIQDAPSIGPLGASNPLNMINTADIESIEVLKDADATAIYGSRGANGVILITTKKAKRSKLTLDANFYSGFGKVAHHPQYLNTSQYLQMRNEALINDNSPPHPTDYDLLWGSSRYTNWEKVMLGGAAYIQDEQLAIYAGNTNVQYRASGGYRRETTAFPGDFGYKKLCGRIHIALSTPNEKGKAIITSSYINERNILPPTDLSAFATTAPNSPPMYTNDGLLNWEDNTFDNPMGNLYRPYKATSSNMMATAALSYEILPGLLLKANMGGGIMQMEETQINPWNSFNLSSYDYDTSGGFSYFADGTIENWIAEPQISYQKRIGKGQLTVLIGTTLQQEVRSQKAFFASGYSSNSQLGNIEDAAEIDPLGRSYYQYRYGALFGRINYNLNGQYILNLTARRDGSSRFGAERKIANFGAIGAGWIFSKAGWVQALAPILSFGKLRVSYGITGNDQIADYAYSSTFTSTSTDVPILLEYDGRGGRLPSRLSDPFYSWEQSKKAEIGLELGFINDRVIFTTNFYLNRSSNQLVSHGVPLQTGFSTLLSNFPAVVENKGMELELNTINIKHTNFSWTTAFNMSCPSNKLFSFNNIKNTNYNNFLAVGKPLDIIKGFHYEGVNSTTGMYQVTGVDSIPSTTKGVLCYGGFSNSLQYKGWQLDILFQFVKQNQYNYMLINQPPGIPLSNQPVEVLERWQRLGDKGNIQKFTQGITETYKAYINVLRSDEAIQNASYIRLKSVSLGYRLPNSWAQRIHLQNMRFYLQGQNLLTFTSYKGRDPEVAADRDIYPPLRLWVAGFQLNL